MEINGFHKKTVDPGGSASDRGVPFIGRVGPWGAADDGGFNSKAVSGRGVLTKGGFSFKGRFSQGGAALLQKLVEAPGKECLCVHRCSVRSDTYLCSNGPSIVPISAL